MKKSILKIFSVFLVLTIVFCSIATSVSAKEKTAAEAVRTLEAELAEAYEMHDTAKGKDAAQSFASLVKLTIIEQLLDGIKNG